MKRLALSLAAAVALIGGFASSTLAYDWATMNGAQNNVYTSTTQLPLVAIGDCNGGCDMGCDSCDDCCCSGGIFWEAEALVLQYFRADGMRVGDDVGNDVDNEYNISPRLSLGYIGAGGLGVRIRWFDYDHTDAAVNGLGSLNVDTAVIDIEVFERVDLSCNWNVEGSFGLRWNEFEETMLDAAVTRSNSFDGWGLIAGLELRRQLYTGAVYGRVRQSILTGDQVRINAGSGTDVLQDTIVAISEINIGYELTRELASGRLLYLRTGGEYQLWSNYSSAFDGVVGEDFWDGTSDVGFAGFSLSAGLLY